MNTRRQFFQKLALGAAAFAILPGAKTYERIWRPKSIVPVLAINPDYVNAEWKVEFYFHSRAFEELGISTRQGWRFVDHVWKPQDFELIQT